MLPTGDRRSFRGSIPLRVKDAAFGAPVCAGLTCPFSPSHLGNWSNQLHLHLNHSCQHHPPRNLPAQGLGHPQWSKGQLLSGASLLGQALCQVRKLTQGRIKPETIQ